MESVQTIDHPINHSVDHHGLHELKPANHLDHLFRQTRIYHTQLSQMADVKASMLLTLASIIVTFSIGYLKDPILRWPVVVMIFFSVMTILAAAYAVMPKLNMDAEPDLENPSFNILFFGSFFNMEYKDYIRCMDKLVHDPTLVYEAEMREIYQVGVYLGRQKYRYIRYAYTLFLAGVVGSVLMLILVEIARLAA